MFNKQGLISIMSNWLVVTINFFVPHQQWIQDSLDPNPSNPEIQGAWI